MHTYEKLSELQALVGSILGTSEWLSVDQARIDQFAAATGDEQWIHVDPVRAAAGPFGTTVALSANGNVALVADPGAHPPDQSNVF